VLNGDEVIARAVCRSVAGVAIGDAKQTVILGSAGEAAGGDLAITAQSDPFDGRHIHGSGISMVLGVPRPGGEKQ